MGHTYRHVEVDVGTLYISKLICGLEMREEQTYLFNIISLDLYDGICASRIIFGSFHMNYDSVDPTKEFHHIIM